MVESGKSTHELEKEIARLRERLEEAEDTLEAIRTGSVDAVAISGEGGTRIYTLEGADETYRMLIENMSESALTLNRDAIILYSNTQFSNLLNVPLSQIIGSSFIRFLPDDLHNDFFKLFDKGWNTLVKGEFMIQLKDGKLLHIHLSLNAIAVKDMEVLGMIITDLSERKELEKLAEAKQNLDLLNIELLDKNKQLTKTNFDLDSFIYTASHDLKAPISNIEGLIVTLESILKDEDLLEEEISAIIDMMSRSVLRFKRTILDLTEITKTQKNFEDDFTLNNCLEIIEDVKESIFTMINSRNAKIHININNCTEIFFSRKNLKSIIYNLLSNAIKYSSPDRPPVIFIESETLNDCTVLVVKDNGLGIKQADLVKVFSMFKRLHDHVEGTGVGLYIVKRIVDNAGGKIEIESDLGKGTTFKVYFKN